MHMCEVPGRSTHKALSGERLGSLVHLFYAGIVSGEDALFSALRKLKVSCSQIPGGINSKRYLYFTLSYLLLTFSSCPSI